MVWIISWLIIYVEVLRYVAAMGGESMFVGRNYIVITGSENAVLTIVCREFDTSRPIDTDHFLG